jgi:tetratricopeptide (TPR) repeat protein|tara:strand:+ start:3746 stop:5308 length:1563 start_codon:yes stop_codon:yes gene_type:complete
MIIIILIQSFLTNQLLYLLDKIKKGNKMKNRTLIFSLLITASLFIGCNNSDGEMARQTGEASREAAAGLDAAHHVMFDVARAEFDKGIDKDPNCVTCYLNKAHAEQDRVLKRELFETALELSKPGHPETVLAQAAVDWINGEGNRFAGYSDLYKKYPNDRFLAAGAYRSLQSEDKVAEARVMLLEAAERLNAGHLYNLLAYSYMWNIDPESEEYDMALPYIEKYIELDPKQANALDSLAEFYLNKGDYDLAVRYYMEATQLDPNFSWGPRNTALAQYQAKLSMDKGNILKVTSDNDEAKNAFDMGRWQLYNLEWENAHKSFSNAIELDGSFALAYAMRARTSGFLGNQGDIADDLDIAVSMSLNASEDEAAMINAVANDMKNGTSTFNVLSESLSDKYSDDSFLAFETVFATISDRGADVVLERAKALYAMNPNFTPVLNMMGYAYMDKGDLDNAGKKFQEQIRRAAGSANPYDSMGDYYLEMDNKVDALKYFEQSAKMGLKASVSKADSLRSELNKEDN